jgi:hypothetical protein
MLVNETSENLRKNGNEFELGVGTRKQKIIDKTIKA